MSAEAWRPVVGYEGLYDVSNVGRVRNAQRKRLMKLAPRQHHGDLKVTLSNAGEASTLLVHRLVLAAFTGPCPPGLECLHGNGNPADNRVENLRWGSRPDNQRDSIRHGTHNCATKVRCRRKHPLFPPNLVRYSAAKGERNCLACMRGHADVNRAKAAGCELSLQEASDRHYALILNPPPPPERKHCDELACPQFARSQSAALCEMHYSRARRASSPPKGLQRSAGFEFEPGAAA